MIFDEISFKDENGLMYDLRRQLRHYNLTRRQLVDIALLIDRLRSLFLNPATLDAEPVFRAPNTKQLTYYLKDKGMGAKRIDRALTRLRLAFKQLYYK